MTDPDIPQAPEDLGEAGRGLWLDVVESFEMEPHDLTMLGEACRISDRLGELRAVVARDGVTVESPQGMKGHPALVESRQQAIAQARLITALRLPDEDDQPRKPHRGPRGTYAPRR